MDGQGWDIPYKKVRPINIDGETLEVMDLELVREVNGQILKAHYYFFWVGMGTSTPSYASMKWMNMWDNFTKNLNHRWAYPGMFVYENPNAENPRLDAWERGKVILKSAIPVFHKDFRTVEK